MRGCRFEARHTAEQPGAGLIGGGDFDCVSVQVWPCLILVGGGYTGPLAADPRQQVLVMGVAALLNFEDPRVRLIGHFRQNQQVVAAAGLGRLPLITVLVEARKYDVVPGDSADPVFPNRRLDGSDAEFGCGF